MDKSDTQSNNGSYSPASLGFHMPAEWTRHERCWMAWPRRNEVWGDRLAATRNAYANVAHAIRQFEPVTMLVDPKDIKQAGEILAADIDILELEIDDSWTRDTGPCFIVNDQGELAGVDLRFNAWGNKYQPHDRDAMIARRILEHVDVPGFASQLTAEGGGITVDGQGTLITTESCFLNSNRNKGWSKTDVDVELKRLLGVEKVIWLPGNVEEVETDGHVDGIAAFVRPGLVLMERSLDPYGLDAEIMEENIAAMKNVTDAQGRPIELAFIEEAHSVQEDGIRFCRSYINSYFANGGVIMPSYNIPEDERAKAVFQELFPDRRVVQIAIHDIAIGGGGIHCITQQQPDALATRATTDVGRP